MKYKVTEHFSKSNGRSQSHRNMLQKTNERADFDSLKIRAENIEVFCIQKKDTLWILFGPTEC